MNLCFTVFLRLLWILIRVKYCNITVSFSGAIDIPEIRNIIGTLMNVQSKYNPKLSIITVVHNGEKYIERTILSVTGQSYTNIEYLIIDGGSTDGTVGIIKKYQKNIADWVSEKDQGIYDAMNKGLKRAKGHYVLFLNSGDELYSGNTIESVFSQNDGSDVYYGETEIFNEKMKSMGGRRLKAPSDLNWKSFRFGMCVCHQSFIIKRELAPFYNLKYKFVSDFDWMINGLKHVSKIHNTNLYLSKFMTGGVSRQNTIQSLWERFSIMIYYYGMLTAALSHFVIAYKFIGFVTVHRKIN